MDQDHMKISSEMLTMESVRQNGYKIVAIGGGTGLSTMLRGLKEYTENITAIVTVADDGGGSGVLRSDLGMLPPGDIRNCILALANTEKSMFDLLNYRFCEGSLAGQSFGNLFLAALNGVCGTFDEAVTRMSDVLAITGRVLPVTTSDVHIEAEFENGKKILGESRIFEQKKIENCRIKRIRMIPENPPALPNAINAIKDADVIVFGPGSLYTSIIPNLLVDGIVDAVAGSDALKIYVLNVMTQEGETEGYSAADHVRELFRHAGTKLFDYCLANNEIIPREYVERYAAEGAEPLYAGEGMLDELGVKLVNAPLLSHAGGYVRHSPGKLARAITAVACEMRPRGGIYVDYERVFSDF